MRYLEAFMFTLLYTAFGLWTIGGVTWLYKNFEPAVWLIAGIAVTVIYIRMLRKGESK